MKKSEMIVVRVTPVEKQALYKVAESELRDPPEMLREIIREAAQRRGLWPMGEQVRVVVPKAA